MLDMYLLETTMLLISICESVNRFSATTIHRRGIDAIDWNVIPSFPKRLQFVLHSSLPERTELCVAQLNVENWKAVKEYAEAMLTINISRFPVLNRPILIYLVCDRCIYRKIVCELDLFTDSLWENDSNFIARNCCDNCCHLIVRSCFMSMVL